MSPALPVLHVATKLVYFDVKYVTNERIWNRFIVMQMGTDTLLLFKIQ